MVLPENEVEKISAIWPDLKEPARICGITTKGVGKWIKLRRMPYTELTGHTTYSALLAAADKRLDRDRLINTAKRGADAPSQIPASVSP